MVKDPEVADPIRFLRAREVVHFQRFGEALRSVQDELNSKNFYAFNPSFDAKTFCAAPHRRGCWHVGINYGGNNLFQQYGNMEAMNYVKPELIVVAFVLYFFGVALRQAQAVKNKYIPLILGGISMVLCAVWVMATSEIETAKEGAMAVFTAVTQGILVAGLSNYVNQIIKQIHKPE